MNKSKRGRPSKEVDWDTFEKLCEIQCTQKEMAFVLGVHPETLSYKAKETYEEDYQAVYERYSAKGIESLRRSQFNLAKTNASMAIWLGKQYLGQKDTVSENNFSPDAVKQFNTLMYQLSKVQSSQAKIEDNSANAAQRS